MFDVGLSEMMVILVVALIVIGPERLPKVARTMGLLWGRAQRYINGIKNDISRDLAMEEMRQLKEKVQQEATAVEQSARTFTQTLDQQVELVNRAAVTAPTQIQAVETFELQPTPSPQQQKFPID
jgi:sec-independent protein translocase protein TatB